MPDLRISATPETVELVTEALREAATRRQRAATRASGELPEGDQRRAALKIAKILREAFDLEVFAADIELSAQADRDPEKESPELDPSDPGPIELDEPADSETVAAAAEQANELHAAAAALLGEDEIADPIAASADV